MNAGDGAQYSPGDEVERVTTLLWNKKRQLTVIDE